MGKHQAPVEHTCPIIDRVKRSIKDAKSLCKSRINNIDDAISILSDIVSELDLDSDLEEIRSANSALRDWGYDKCKEVDECNNEISDLLDEIESLKTQLQENNEEINELQIQISNLEKEYNGR
jgi:chromosome segregation ATPase